MSDKRVQYFEAMSQEQRWSPANSSIQNLHDERRSIKNIIAAFVLHIEMDDVIDEETITNFLKLHNYE